MESKNTKHLYWVIGLIVITLIFCLTLIYLNNHPYKFKIEMDDNTLEAVKSINWTSLGNKEQSYSSCVYPSSCFTNYSDYLNQFPEKKQPNVYCTYPIYCGDIIKYKGGFNSSQP